MGALLLAGVIRLAAAEAEQPLTIMPFQAATFVSDADAAAALGGFAEFSARLLYWTDTPRGPVLLAGQMLKPALLPFIEEWRGLAGSRTRWPGPGVGERVHAAYRSLEGPRLARLTIGAEVVFIPPLAVDAIAGDTVEVPVIVENIRNIPVQVEIAGAGKATEAGSALNLVLPAGHSIGAFLNLQLPREGLAALTVQVDGQQREFGLVVRRHRRGTLVVEILDEAGQATAARVYLTAADHRAHAPAGVMHRLVSGEAGQPFAGDAYFHTAGKFSVDLPAGPAVLEIVKGLEYEPVSLPVQIGAGPPANVTVRLKRRATLQQAGWYSGDVHVHANLFAQDLIKPADVLLVAQAEDLNVVSILPCNDPRTATINDGKYFTGGPDAVSTPDRVVVFGEEMRNDIFGHVGFLNLKSFVEPAYFGWPNSPHPHDYPGNYPQAAQARAQGGVVTYVHPGLPSEFPVDIALGVADTIDVMSQNAEDQSTAWWYRLLNCGFRCPISAGTDSFLNIPLHLIPGAGRVYVKVGAAFNYARWIEGYRAGRSFATNGPLLRFTAGGREPGDEIVAAGPMEIDVVGEAQSLVPMEALEIVVNGEIVHRQQAGADPLSIRIAKKVWLERSGWVALRAKGPGHRLAPNDREVFAHTSPVYFTQGGRKPASRVDALFFSEQIDALIAKMDDRGVFAARRQRDEIAARFREAQEIYRRIAAEDPSAP